MILRILNEGQFELDESSVQSLGSLDDAVEQAVGSGNQDQLGRALHRLLEQVRASGTVLSDDDLRDSELILPAADSTVEEVRELLSDSDEGLIPS